MVECLRGGVGKEDCRLLYRSRASPLSFCAVRMCARDNGPTLLLGQRRRQREGGWQQFNASVDKVEVRAPQKLQRVCEEDDGGVRAIERPADADLLVQV